MKVGTRVEIVDTDYETKYSDPHLANGSKGEIVEIYDDKSLYIVKMDNDPDCKRDGWSFYPHQIKEVK